ncbi:hypothetical protein [Acrocarpospora phusangensis]|nr:hypothetical protein [Acrocarpospora phusangensis]
MRRIRRRVPVLAPRTVDLLVREDREIPLTVRASGDRARSFW